MGVPLLPEICGRVREEDDGTPDWSEWRLRPTLGDQLAVTSSCALTGPAIDPDCELSMAAICLRVTMSGDRGFDPLRAGDMSPQRRVLAEAERERSASSC